MKLLRSDGKIAYIISLEIEVLDFEERTYNFEVEKEHNYYVGDSGVLVHNAECGTLGALQQKKSIKFKK